MAHQSALPQEVQLKEVGEAICGYRWENIPFIQQYVQVMQKLAAQNVSLPNLTIYNKQKE